MATPDSFALGEIYQEKCRRVAIASAPPASPVRRLHSHTMEVTAITAQNAAALLLTVKSSADMSIAATAGMICCSGSSEMCDARTKAHESIMIPALTKTSAFNVCIIGPKIPNKTNPMHGLNSTAA